MRQISRVTGTRPRRIEKTDKQSEGIVALAAITDQA